MATRLLGAGLNMHSDKRYEMYSLSNVRCGAFRVCFCICVCVREWVIACAACVYLNGSHGLWHSKSSGSHETVQIFPSAGLVWLFCQHLYERTFKFLLQQIQTPRGAAMLVGSLPAKNLSLIHI